MKNILVVNPNTKSILRSFSNKGQNKQMKEVPNYKISIPNEFSYPKEEKN